MTKSPHLIIMPSLEVEVKNSDQLLIINCLTIIYNMIIPEIKNHNNFQQSSEQGYTL